MKDGEIHKTLSTSFKQADDQFLKANKIYQKHKKDIFITREESIMLLSLGMNPVLITPNKEHKMKQSLTTDRNEQKKAKLLKENEILRWEIYSKKNALNFYEDRIRDAKFYFKNPLELKKKYIDVFDYLKRWLLNMHTKYELNFKDSTELFNFLYAQRKIVHEQLANLKKSRKIVRDKLSILGKLN